MRLQRVEVKRFRNILDSGSVEVDRNVTCLVGKNESGKTAFLHALRGLLPARGNPTFSVPDHYPAWLEKRHRLEGLDLDAVEPIAATFTFTDREREILAKSFGPQTLGDPSELTVSRTYGGDLQYEELSVSESDFVAFLVGQIRWARGTKKRANSLRTIAELTDYGTGLEKDEEPEKSSTGRAVATAVAKTLGAATDLSSAVCKTIEEWLPRFLYFSDYSTLPYSVPIAKVLSTDPAQLTEQELTARALLKLAAAEDAYLANADYERRKRELENVSNAITADVLKYWSQNPSLRVQPDITQKTITDQQGKHSVLDELKILVYDDRHQLSLPFHEHSTGFQWFFSFLAAFSEFEHTSDRIVLLLDEPALGLHAKAQADFLRFIEERLAPNHQVIYTTHSPFMVQPGRLERGRVVEDKDPARGSTVSADFATTDPDTLFPLQGALGYDLVQHLFIAPHNLVVEGTSDFTYLQVISDHFKAQGDRTPLDDRWSIVPVGGADLVPTFVALLGHHLDITVVVDAKKSGHQKLQHLSDERVLEGKRIITIGQVVERAEADIEDLFAVSDYLALFNAAFGQSLSDSDLDGNDPIVRRIARKIGVDRFDHGKPADRFLRTRDQVLPTLSGKTCDNFEKLFERINRSLPAQG